MPTERPPPPPNRRIAPGGRGSRGAPACLSAAASGDLRAEALVVKILKKSPKFGPCSAFKSAPRKLLEVFIVRPVVAPATGALRCRLI